MVFMKVIKKILVLTTLVLVFIPFYEVGAQAFIPGIGEGQRVEEYEPISVLPGVIGDGCSGSLGSVPEDCTTPLPTFEDYFNRVFVFIIGIAAALAVILITIGGVRYMTSNVAGSLEDAKDQIRQAILGLVLLLLTYLLLYQINPDLLNIRLGDTLEAPTSSPSESQ
jgi:amino acid transporter